MPRPKEKRQIPNRFNKIITFTLRRTHKLKNGNWQYRLSGTSEKKPIHKKGTIEVINSFLKHWEEGERTAAFGYRNVRTKLTDEQIDDATSALNRLATGKSLTEAVDFFNRLNPSEEKPVLEAYNEFMEDRKHDARPRTIKEYRTILSKWANQHSLWNVGKITSTRLGKYISKGSIQNQTYNNRLRVFKAFFNFCKSKGWAAENPALGVRKRKVHHSGRKAFINYQDMKEIFNKANDGEWKVLIPYLCLVAFCGVRRSEVARIGWGNVTLDEEGNWYVEVVGADSKTGDSRNVQIPDNAKYILEAHYGKDFTPKAFESKISRFMKLCKNDGINWPDNGLRHSFGTYHYALYRNEVETAYSMGNSPRVLNKHYKGLTTKIDAGKYFTMGF